MTSLIVAVTTTTTKGSSFTSSALSMLNIYAYCDCGGKLSKKVCTNTFSDSQIAEFSGTPFEHAGCVQHSELLLRSARARHRTETGARYMDALCCKNVL